MNGYTVTGFEPVNPVELDKVAEIKESIKLNGWNGCPILCYGNCLLTGSHRQAALRELESEDFDISFDCAADVTDIIDNVMQENEWDLSDVFANTDSLRYVFAGTWVEEYKKEIREW